MRSDALGELQALILAATLRLGERAYGYAIYEEIEKERSLSLGALYTTLDRLQDRGYVSSKYGEPTSERGGRAKRYFRVEAAGEAALADFRNRAPRWPVALGAEGLPV